MATELQVLVLVGLQVTIQVTVNAPLYQFYP